MDGPEIKKIYSRGRGEEGTRKTVRTPSSNIVELKERIMKLLLE